MNWLTLADYAGFPWHAACSGSPVGVSAAYRRREPEKTVLWKLVNENLNTFLAAADARAQDGRSLPLYACAREDHAAPPSARGADAGGPSGRPDPDSRATA